MELKVANAQKRGIRRYLSTTSHIFSRDKSADRGQKVAHAQKHLQTENGVSANSTVHTSYKLQCMELKVAHAQKCAIRR
jgi:hypothetical protein